MMFQLNCSWRFLCSYGVLMDYRRGRLYSEYSLFLNIYFITQRISNMWSNELNFCSESPQLSCTATGTPGSRQLAALVPCTARPRELPLVKQHMEHTGEGWQSQSCVAWASGQRPSPGAPRSPKKMIFTIKN